MLLCHTNHTKGGLYVSLINRKATVDVCSAVRTVDGVLGVSVTGPLPLRGEERKRPTWQGCRRCPVLAEGRASRSFVPLDCWRSPDRWNTATGSGSTSYRQDTSHDTCVESHSDGGFPQLFAPTPQAGGGRGHGNTQHRQSVCDERHKQETLAGLHLTHLHRRKGERNMRSR